MSARKRGRPAVLSAPRRYTLRVPAELLLAVAAEAARRGLSAQAAWRQAAAEWLAEGISARLAGLTPPANKESDE